MEKYFSRERVQVFKQKGSGTELAFFFSSSLGSLALGCSGSTAHRHTILYVEPVDPIGQTPTPTMTLEEMQAELGTSSRPKGKIDPTHSPLGGVRGVHEPQILGCNVTKFCTKIDFVKHIYF